MRTRLPALCALALLSACASAADEDKIGPLGFYDWVERRSAEYAAALDQGDRQLEAMLRQQMARQVQKRYDAVVETASTSEDPSRRELAVCALGFSERPESVAHLEPRLADPVSTVRGTAAAAIGFLNPPNPPVEKIGALLDDADAYVRQAALFAIKLVAKPTAPLPADVLQKVKRLAQEDARVEVRNEAVIALGRIQAKDTVDLLWRKCLEDESALVRRNAAFSLGLFGSNAREAVPRLVDRLKDGETMVVEVAHWALKKITGRVEADRTYASWADWLQEISKVLEFACPSHPEEKSASPGSCPKCGLRMEPRAIPGAEFACPEHPEVVSSKAGKCPKCQKELLPRKKDEVK